MSPGFVIAINVILLYLLLGPPVLFGIYLLFDVIEKAGQKGQNFQSAIWKKNPALWTLEDIDASDSDGAAGHI